MSTKTEVVKKPESLKELIENEHLSQAKKLKGYLYADFDDLKKFVEDNKNITTEDELVHEIVIRAFGCIQPVSIKQLSVMTDIPVKKLNEYKKSLSPEINAQRKRNQEYLIGVLDAVDVMKLMSPKANHELSRFVRENVLGQKIKEERGSIIMIKDLKIEMNSDLRTQIVNTTPGQKELFFNGNGRRLPPQIKPTDEVLSEYVEAVQEVVEKKLIEEKEREEDEKENTG